MQAVLYSEKMTLTFGSLFSGVGGFDLGFERSGMECRWQVEIDPFCQQVLEKHWPDVRRYGDVRECGGNNLEPVDVIAGGFPCQPHSVAGRRRGESDERDLWGEFARIIGELKPRWIVGENVLGILSSNNGRFFGRVLRDLAQSGYDATWRVLTARAFGAPHLRERVYIVANCDGKRIEGFWEKPICRVSAFSWCQDVRGIADLRERPDIPEPLIRRKGNGVSARVDAIGNAVVPQIVEWIGHRIMEVEQE